MAILSTVPLALIYQRLYVYSHAHLFSALTYGFWVAMAGAIVVTVGSLLEFWAIARSNC